MTTLETVTVRGLGSVPPQYEHHDKEIVPATRLSLPGTVLKWYDIQRSDAPVPAEIRRMARLFLVDEAELARRGVRARGSDTVGQAGGGATVSDPEDLTPARGYDRLFRASVMQAPDGCDFDFLRGR